MLSIITAATKVRIDALSLLLLLSYSLQGARACVIQGVDSGVCITETQFAASTSFCSSYVRYPVCVPTPLPGFPQLTATAKDSWVQDQVTSYTAQRRAIESGALIPTDPTYSNYSAGATVTSRFSNPDCQRAYTAFMCYLAFPRCDPSGASVRVCQSVCENLFRSCKYDKKLWRCYNPLVRARSSLAVRVKAIVGEGYGDTFRV